MVAIVAWACVSLSLACLPPVRLQVQIFQGKKPGHCAETLAREGCFYVGCRPSFLSRLRAIRIRAAGRDDNTTNLLEKVFASRSAFRRFLVDMIKKIRWENHLWVRCSVPLVRENVARAMCNAQKGPARPLPSSCCLFHQVVPLHRVWKKIYGWPPAALRG